MFVTSFFGQEHNYNFAHKVKMQYLQIVAGQEKPHMCIWPLSMYLLQNIQEELSEISFIHVPGTQLKKSLKVFDTREHV